MRIALVTAVAVLMLAGCGRVSSPTPTPDIATVHGYRQATEARGEQVRGTVEQLHQGCSKGVITDCTAALAKHQAAVAEPERMIRTTKAPQGCVPLFSGYAGLMDNLADYRTTLATALATGNPSSVSEADTLRYRMWSEGWAGNGNYLKTDPCK